MTWPLVTGLTGLHNVCHNYCYWLLNTKEEHVNLDTGKYADIGSSTRIWCNCRNSKNEIFAKKRNLCQEVYWALHMYQIWRNHFHLWGHECKFWMWPYFGCKVNQWPNCDKTQTWPVVPPNKSIYQVSNWYLESCWIKFPKTWTYGETNRWMDKWT